MTNLRQHLVFSLAGPVMSLVLVIALGFGLTIVKVGLREGLDNDLAKIILLLMKPIFLVFYLVSMMFAFGASCLFSKMLTAHRYEWLWFVASVTCMIFGPPLVAITSGLRLDYAVVTLLSAAGSVIVCGMISRAVSRPAAEA